MIARLLIANRGEIAVRIARACREMDIESVAVYADADAGAPHVAVADRAVALGPGGPEQTYLSVPALLAAARTGGADAVHPGYGFLSENARFADACTQAGLAWVGPPGDVIARMGSKIEARRTMAAAGVPVVPGDTPREQTDSGLAEAIARVGLPVLVKAAAGGGGKGMRVVREPADIPEAVQAARREALAAFGDGALYVERLLDRPRHVEVQIFADGHGQVVHLFERECSIQRRHQKIIEESPAPGLSHALRDRMVETAREAARAASYHNAGTVEFLVEGSGHDARFYFLEMNTRLQVEHPVTEFVVGVDIVRAQLLVASGLPLPWSQDALCQRGHAIEARVYAEDPAREFVPQAGRLLLYRAPHLPGVRVDSGVVEGGDVSVHYDPLLAKVIASGETRAMAIARLVAALRAFPILGVVTNIPFLVGILTHPRFQAGEIDTGFLDTESAALTAACTDTVPASVRAAMAAHASDAVATLPGGQHDPWTGGAFQTARPRLAGQ